MWMGSNLFAMLLVLTRIIHVHNYYLCVFVMLFDVLRGFGLNLVYLIDDFTKRSTLNLLAMLLVVLKDHIFIFFCIVICYTMGSSLNLLAMSLVVLEDHII